MTQQSTIGTDSVSKGLLSALLEDEAALTKAHRALVEATAHYDVVIRRYAAMREAVRERIGTSPYSKNVQWPLPPSQFPTPRPTGRHFRFRFIRLKVGDAIAEVLAESEQPLAVDEITEALKDGGLSTRDSRAVNAALINMKGIKKTGDSKYYFEEEPPFDDVDDLPF